MVMSMMPAMMRPLAKPACSVMRSLGTSLQGRGGALGEVRAWAWAEAGAGA